MIVLDASVLIGQLDSTDPHHHRAAALLSATGATPLGAHQITLAEVLVGPTLTGRLDATLEALGRLGVQPLTSAADAHLRLASLRASTRLKLPDCCVILAAEQVGGELATVDVDLAQQARARGLTVRD